MHLKLKDGYDLKKGVAAVAVMASKAIFHIGDHGLSIKASIPDSSILMVFRIDCSGFITFKDVKEMYGEIDPKELEKFLESVVDESVSISANIHGSNILTFELESRFQELYSQPLHGKIQKSVKIVFNEVNDASQMIEDLPYDTKAIVSTPYTGLPSILLKLVNSLAQLVDVSITATQLKFFAKCVGIDEETEIVLTKEEGKCKIAGVAENDVIQFSFGLEFKMLLAFSDASDLSENVWMFTPAKPGSPLLLVSPVGTKGSIKFYLPLQHKK